MGAFLQGVGCEWWRGWGLVLGGGFSGWFVIWGVGVSEVGWGGVVDESLFALRWVGGKGLRGFWCG